MTGIGDIWRVLLTASVAFLSTCPVVHAAPQAEVVRVAAAGSLTGALTQIAASYHVVTGADVHLRFGPAGLLRKEIEYGTPVDVFLSANLAHPRAVAKAGRATVPVIVTRNHLCATTLPGFDLTTSNFVGRLLDPKVGIGTSTPGADPGGDYAQRLFDNVDALRPGAGAVLRAKARQIVGGEIAPQQAPAHVVDAAFSSGRVQVFIGYCSRRTVQLDTRYASVPVPGAVAPAVNYGMAVIHELRSKHKLPEASHLR